MSMSRRKSFIEEVYESACNSTQWTWYIHAMESQKNVARHARSLWALRKWSYKRSERKSDHRRKWKNRSGRRGNSPGTVNVVRRKVYTLKTTEPLTTNVSAVIQARSNPKRLSMVATHITNGLSAPYVNSTFFFACVRKSYTISPNPHF